MLFRSAHLGHRRYRRRFRRPARRDLGHASVGVVDEFLDDDRLGASGLSVALCRLRASKTLPINSPQRPEGRAFYFVLYTLCFVLCALYFVLCSTRCAYRENSKFQVPSSKFQVQSSKFKVQSSKYKVPSSKFQVPSTKFQPAIVQQQYAERFQFLSPLPYYPQSTIPHDPLK